MEMKWVGLVEHVKLLESKKTHAACLSAGLEEAEQQDEEEYNLFVSFCKDMKISKMFKDTEVLYEPCFHRGITFD